MIELGIRFGLEEAASVPFVVVDEASVDLPKYSCVEESHGPWPAFDLKLDEGSSSWALLYAADGMKIKLCVKALEPLAMTCYNFQTLPPVQNVWKLWKTLPLTGFKPEKTSNLALDQRLSVVGLNR